MLAFPFLDFLFPTSFSHFRASLHREARLSGANKESGSEFVRGYVPVAQLDRASDYGSEGRGFESSRARISKRPGVAENGDPGAFFVCVGSACNLRDAPNPQYFR